MSEPGYWMYETSGVLRPVIEAYLAGGMLTEKDVATMRAYLRQWIESPIWDQNPYIGPEHREWLASLRAGIEELTCRTAIAVWLDRAALAGLDPL
jgi:hypothetical protein